MSTTTNKFLNLTRSADLTLPFNRCAECDDVITNPVCSCCLTTQMKVMVEEHDPQLAAQIEPADLGGETTCIQCGKDMGLCAHCFSRDIYEFLEEKNQIVAKEFMRRFDFDLRRTFL